MTKPSKSVSRGLPHNTTSSTTEVTGHTRNVERIAQTAGNAARNLKTPAIEYKAPSKPNAVEKITTNIEITGSKGKNVEIIKKIDGNTTITIEKHMSDIPPAYIIDDVAKGGMGRTSRIGNGSYLENYGGGKASDEVPPFANRENIHRNNSTPNYEFKSQNNGLNSGESGFKKNIGSSTTNLSTNNYFNTSLEQPPTLTPKYPVVLYNPNTEALSTTNYFNVPKLYEYIKPVTVKPDFYVGPNGASSTLPATAYRYMDSKWYEATKKEMSGPLSYLGFEKIDTAYQARDRYQIAYDYYNLNNQNRTWSNASVRGTFDTLQLFDSKGNPKVRIPYTKGDTGKELEPFTMSYPEHGQGGAFQLLPVDKMDIKYDKLDILPNPRIDLILREKR